MKISFNKVGRSPSSIDFSQDRLLMSGELLKEDIHKIHFIAKITGELSFECDRCGKEFSQNINLPLDLILVDQVHKVGDDLDTIEFLDGIIDMSLLMESEIASYRSTYHYCKECEQSEVEVDIEY